MSVDWYEAINGGFAAIPSSGVAISSGTLASATAIFAAIPNGCRLVQFTVRGGVVTIAFDGQTPTAGGVGQDYGIGTYSMVLTPQMVTDRPLGGSPATLIQAIGAGGASMYITYFQRADEVTR